MSDPTEKEAEAELEQEKPSDKKEDSKATEKPKKNPVKSGVKFGQFVIQDANPLPKYNVGPLKAYAAIPVKGIGQFIAIVSEPHLPPRHTKRDTYNKIINANAAKLVKDGIVYWPPVQSERHVFIYEDNWGDKFVQPDQDMALSMKQDFVLNYIAKPMVGVLQDFRDKDFVHGSIRADNLYNGGSKDLKRIVLGDGLCMPSGYLQDPTYEPIERAMADKIGKGPGTKESDIYSFGVTLAVLLRHNDPLKGLSSKEIVARKMEQGSYSALTGSDRFTGSILELLRGLLQDDLTQRWTIDEVLIWMDGRRLSPKQSAKRLMAPRPIVFGGQKYLYPSQLAMDLVKYPDEVKRIVEDGELKNWITRAIESAELYERVEEAISMSQNNSDVGGFADRLASNLSVTLDPDAPIRYKSLAMHADGIGAGLAKSYALKEDVGIYAELFSNNLVMNWIKGQVNPNLDIGALVSKFDSCRSFIRQPNSGFGLERCLYLINSEVQCMSDKLKGYHVLNPEELVYAFEDMCEKGKAPALFIDRHIAAFISVKDGKSIDSFLHDLNAPEHYKKVLGNLKCFATIQKRSQLPYLPAIAQAFADQLHVVYKRYHDQSVRDTLKKNITRYAQEGDLVKMAGLLDNADVKKKDISAFKRAMKEYSDLSRETTVLEAKLIDKNKFGLATGQEMAALISSIISAIVILVIAFVYFTDNALF